MKKTLFLLIITIFNFSCEKERLAVESISEYISFEHNMPFYKGKQFSGMLFVRYKNKQFKEKRNYKRGVLHGNQTKWYSDGGKYSERYYVHGVKTGIHQGWWKNGRQKFEFHFNNEGEHDGISNEWFENGIPFKLFHYKNGQEDGSQKMFKPDGSIRANYIVIEGDRFGLIGLKKCDAVSTI
jgi:antitoxin component YwqK of YwqJK toxin-antitoxin module